MAYPLAFPALHASHAGIWIATPDGETRRVGKAEAVSRAADTPHILLNAPLVAQRLGYPELSGLDLLELFAFVHPARFVVPTAKGFAEALQISRSSGEDLRDETVPQLLVAAASKLLTALSETAWPEREGAWDAAQALARLHWSWGRVVCDQVPRPQSKEAWLFSRLPEWEEAPPRTPPRSVQLDRRAVEAQLARLTGQGAEVREGQR
ncbi:MAG: hypothetical protein RIS11_720, partial [Pseudomonadota bacterium]